ncbi:MAG: YraN family protein [Anaerolineae bacterium]|nr:YraN family protein [Anaerolineae bacterium]
MAKTKQATGQRGELLARTYLVERGYIIIETNWRCPHGEIDIVAQHETGLVFVEVRTRHADTTDPALESIVPRKQRHMIKSAQQYLNRHNLDTDWRIDIIAIALPSTGLPVIEHFEDALGW